MSEPWSYVLVVVGCIVGWFVVGLVVNLAASRSSSYRESMFLGGTEPDTLMVGLAILFWPLLILFGVVATLGGLVVRLMK